MVSFTKPSSIAAATAAVALATSSLSAVLAFSVPKLSESAKPSKMSAATLDIAEDEDAPKTFRFKKRITDPLGLYPEGSLERTFGMIEPFEPAAAPINNEQDSTKPIFDPLSLYKGKDRMDVVQMSKSLPFLPQPKHLEGTLPGDRGFDPLNLASAADGSSTLSLDWYRESELKHGRLAMLASVGWIASELFHNSIANTYGMEPLLVGSNANMVPSVLNGGLDRTDPWFWMDVVCASAALEFMSIRETQNTTKATTTPGNPFRFAPSLLSKKQFYNQESELFHGRLAMLAITGFAMQEFFLKNAVVDHTPAFFGSLFH